MVLRLLPFTLLIGATSLAAQVPARAPTKTPAPTAKTATQATTKTRPTLVAIEGHGWFGFRYDVQRDSMFVTAVAEDSPADRAGLRQGDWITLIDGRKANPTTLSEKPPEVGANLTLTVRRGSEKLEMSMVAVAAPAGTYTLTLVPTMADTVALEARTLRGKMALQATKAPAAKITPTDSFGSVDITFKSAERRKTQPLRVDDIVMSDTLGRLVKDPELYEQLKATMKETDVLLKKMAARDLIFAGAELEELNSGLAEYFYGRSEGVFVLRVGEETPAAKAGLRPGDIIERVNGTYVTTVGQLREVVAKSGTGVEISLIRKGQPAVIKFQEFRRVKMAPPEI
jgi:C-terminal processing protease CtpA/Prc